jgi:hypothetical protein
MLETLRQVPFFLNRHREAPLLEEREMFLSHLQQQGTSRASLQILSNELLHVIRLLRLDTMREVSLGEIRHAAERFVIEGKSNPRVRSCGHTASFFMYAAKKWLRFHGRLKMPAPPPVPFAENSISSLAICARSRAFRPTPLTHTARKLRCFCVGSGTVAARWPR